MGEPWTILELSGLAADALAAGPDGPARANGRIRDMPSVRIIRWYASIGLVDPPLSRRGRVARYGRRHLLQLVAVKRRQAEGRSLAEIQAEFTGATDETLARAARLPRGFPESGTRSADAPDSPRDAPAAPERFWTRSPRPASAQDERAGPREPDGPPARAGAENAAAAPASLVHGIQLAPGVTLLLEGTRQAPGPDDIAAIAAAALPLLETLERRALLEEQPAGTGGQPPEPDRQPSEGALHDHRNPGLRIWPGRGYCLIARSDAPPVTVRAGW